MTYGGMLTAVNILGQLLKTGGENSDRIKRYLYIQRGFGRL